MPTSRRARPPPDRRCCQVEIAVDLDVRQPAAFVLRMLETPPLPTVMAGLLVRGQRFAEREAEEVNRHSSRPGAASVRTRALWQVFEAGDFEDGQILVGVVGDDHGGSRSLVLGPALKDDGEGGRTSKVFVSRGRRGLRAGFRASRPSAGRRRVVGDDVAGLPVGLHEEAGAAGSPPGVSLDEDGGRLDACMVSTEWRRCGVGAAASTTGGARRGFGASSIGSAGFRLTV